MRVVFFGSPEFALPALKALHENHEIALVVTQPQRPCGRGQKCRPTPVEIAARESGLEVFAPRAVRTEGFRRRIASIEADYLVVVAYGRILPEPVLDAAKKGALNIHPSLLPRWRGPAPVTWTIYHGDELTGVSIMQMNGEMDAGDIVLSRQTPVFKDESADQLLCRLSCEGAHLLLDVLEAEKAGHCLPRFPQDAERVTCAPFITSELACIDWNRPAREVALAIRAFDSRPGAYSYYKMDRIKLYKPRVMPTTVESGLVRPGTVLGMDAHGLVVACREHAVAVGEIQCPGKRRLPTRENLLGHPIPEGTVLRGKE